MTSIRRTKGMINKKNARSLVRELAMLVLLTGVLILTACGNVEETNLLAEKDQYMDEGELENDSEEITYDVDLGQSDNTDDLETDNKDVDNTDDAVEIDKAVGEDRSSNVSETEKLTNNPTETPRAEEIKPTPTNKPTTKPTAKPTKAAAKPAKGNPSTPLPSGLAKGTVLTSHDKSSHTFDCSSALPNGGSIYKVIVDFGDRQFLMMNGYDNSGRDFYVEYYGNDRLAFKKGWPTLEDEDRSEIRSIGDEFIKAYKISDKARVEAKDTNKLKPSPPVPSNMLKGAVLDTFDENAHAFDYFSLLPNKGIVDGLLVSFGERSMAMISGHDNLGRAFSANYYSDGRFGFSFSWPDLESDDMDAIKSIGQELLIVYGIIARPSPTPVPRDPYMDAPLDVSDLLSGAELISAYEFHHTYSYDLALSKGGSIKQVTVCFGDLSSYVSMEGYDNSGSPFSLDYSRGHATFNTFGKADLENKDHVTISVLGEELLDAYGLQL